MNIEQLELAVRKARERARAGKGSLAEQLAAFSALSEAQRALAAAQGRQYAVPFDVGCVPEAAVSGPLLFQSEEMSFLTFNAVKQVAPAHREDAGTAIVEIVGCLKTKFGHPNDEALPGHPLYENGLTAYGVFEVMNSAWCREVAAVNRVNFPETADTLGRHFIVTFHDSTFECVGNSLQVSLSQAPRKEIVAELSRKVLGD